MLDSNRLRTSRRMSRSASSCSRSFLVISFSGFSRGLCFISFLVSARSSSRRFGTFAGSIGTSAGGPLAGETATSGTFAAASSEATLAEYSAIDHPFPRPGTMIRPWVISVTNAVS